MKKADAVRVFGTQTRIAELCGLTPQAVSKWPAIVPFYWQHYLAAISDGKLRAQMRPKARKHG